MRLTSLLYKILPTNLGACKPTFHTIYTSYLRWNSTMRYCLYRTDLGQNAVLGNSRKYPYPATNGFHVLTPPPLPSEIPKCVNPPPPPCPQTSIIVTPLPFRISGFFLEVHFRLSNAYMNKRTWIYAFSSLWSSGARQQVLLFSDKKNLPLVARLCKLLFKSELGYKNKHHLR